VAAVLALVEPLLPLDLDRRLDLSALGIGAVLAIGSLAYLAISPAAGRWSDRRGRPAPLVAGTLILVCGLPFLAVGPVWFVAAALVATTAGLALVNASASPLVIESLEEVDLAGRHALAGGVLNVVFGAGYAIGPLAGGAMRAVAPFWLTVLCAAILTLIAGRWIVVRLRTP
jgi:MFS family permease